jgi:hypothetical protein
MSTFCTPFKQFVTTLAETGWLHEFGLGGRNFVIRWFTYGAVAPILTALSLVLAGHICLIADYCCKLRDFLSGRPPTPFFAPPGLPSKRLDGATAQPEPPGDPPAAACGEGLTRPWFGSMLPYAPKLSLLVLECCG